METSGARGRGDAPQERRQEVGTREASGTPRPRIRRMSRTVVPTVTRETGVPLGAGSEAAGTGEGFSLPVSPGASDTPGQKALAGQHQEIE